MRAKLVLKDDKRKPTVLRLKKLPMTLGRGREADLTVAHPMISRLHCEFYGVENTLCIRDLGSLNGTFVGGIRIEEASLESGDVLMVGSAEFEIVIEDDQDLMPPPTPVAEADTHVGAADDEEFVEIDVDFEPADDLSEDFSEIVELEGADAAGQKPKQPRQPAAKPEAAAKKPSSEPKAASKPTASKPTASKPAASKPAASKPAASKPAASKPAASKPAASKPAASKPTASKPTASKPTASKPTASKPTASKPAASKPAASKPAASKPAASKPAASKPAASKPTASKPTASKPAAPQPTSTKQPGKETSPAEKSIPGPKSKKATPTKKVSSAKTVSFEPGSDAAPDVEKDDDDLNDFLAGLQ